MKKILGLIVIFIVFYMGAHYYLRWKNTVTDDVTKLRRLAECSSGAVDRVSIERNLEGVAKETLDFQRDVGGWRFVSPDNGDADNELINRIVSTLCEDTYDPEPVGRAKGAEELGLNTPAYSLKLREGAGKTTLVYFGKTSADRMSQVAIGGVAARDFFKIAPRLQGMLARPVKEYQNYRVMAGELDNIQAVKVEKNGKELFSLEREGADFAVLKGGKSLGPGSEEATKYVNRLSTLKAMELLDVHYGKERCEGEVKDFVLKLDGVAGRKEEIRFTAKAEALGAAKEKRIKACDSGRASLFAVHPDMLAYLDMQPSRLLAKKKVGEN